MRVDAELYDICKDFIRENGIGCEEDIYQSDRVSTNALELVEQICELLGYYEPEEDEEEDYED